jgi:hypothetical protein
MAQALREIENWVVYCDSPKKSSASRTEEKLMNLSNLVSLRCGNAMDWASRTERRRKQLKKCVKVGCLSFLHPRPCRG